jgi:antibiotic biosynthesis monooxygenase (ABM) superfamily enzyme
VTTTISTDQDIATLINVFTVGLDNQQQLVDLLDEATTQVIRHLPGFISANIHASLDGTES